MPNERFINAAFHNHSSANEFYFDTSHSDFGGCKLKRKWHKNTSAYRSSTSSHCNVSEQKNQRAEMFLPKFEQHFRPNYKKNRRKSLLRHSSLLAAIFVCIFGNIFKKKYIKIKLLKCGHFIPLYWTRKILNKISALPFQKMSE